MPFDMSLVQRGARLRQSPFYEAEQAYGPRGYTVYNHMLFPINFDDFEAEYWHLLRHVTLWDVAVERQLEVQGRDGFRFAQLLTPRDLSKCAVGQGKYVLITAPDGGIVNDPVMLRLGENHFWFALASSDALLYAIGLAARPGLGRPALRARCLPGPDPGAPLQGRGAGALRRRDPVAEVLLVPRAGARWHPGDRDPHRLDRRGRVRGLPARRQPRDRALGADHGGGPAVRHPAHRTGRHPARRGRHPQLGRRHDDREQPIRGGARAALQPGRRRSSSRARRPCGGSATRASSGSWWASRSAARSST